MLRHHLRRFSTTSGDLRSIATLIASQPTPFPSHFLSSLPLSASSLPVLLRFLLRHRLSAAVNLLLSLRHHHSHLLSDHLFNPLIRSLSLSGRLRSAVSLFRLMPSLSVAPSTITFNSLLAALFRRGQTQNAHQLFDEMLHSNTSPDTCTFNTLIRGLSLNGDISAAFAFFHRMQDHDCSPDVVTYNTLLDGLCRSRKLDNARNFLNGMRREGSTVLPNVVSYTTLIRGYCANGGDVNTAVEVFYEMAEMGLKPNKVTYNTLVKGLCEAQRMDLVKEVLERGDEFKPDTCTFNTLMAAHCSFGRVDDAVEVFERMLELRVKTDSASYSMLILGLCKSGEFGRAEALVDEILEKGVLGRRGVSVPLMAAYNPIFEHLCQNGKAASKAGMLLRELVERRATMDYAAFKTVILGYCREGKLRDGYKILASMVRRNLKPDSDIFEALIEGFLAKEDAGFACKALERMLNCGHRPSTGMFHSVIAGLLKKGGLAEEAGNLVAVMAERKVRHNIDLSTDVVGHLFVTGLNDRAFEIVRLIYDNGCCVKMEKLVESLCNGKKYAEAQAILLFSLERDENLAEKVYARAISGLCAAGSASEAFELFYGMTEKENEFAISSCLNELRNALERAGKLREAEFVCKQMTRVKSEPQMSRSKDTGTSTQAWYKIAKKPARNSKEERKNSNGVAKVSHPRRMFNTTQLQKRSTHA